MKSWAWVRSRLFPRRPTRCCVGGLWKSCDLPLDRGAPWVTPHVQGGNLRLNCGHAEDPHRPRRRHSSQGPFSRSWPGEGSRFPPTGVQLLPEPWGMRYRNAVPSLMFFDCIFYISVVLNLAGGTNPASFTCALTEPFFNEK